MKILKAVSFLTALLLLSGLFSCAQAEGDTTSAVTDAPVQAVEYEQISQQRAKELMDSETDYTIIDARTDEEFKAGHIEGAVMIPEYEIKEKAEALIPDKDRLILVYCRSGRRSKIASEELVKLGYTNVKEFGGIIDWPYDIVK